MTFRAPKDQLDAINRCTTYHVRRLICLSVVRLLMRSELASVDIVMHPAPRFGCETDVYSDWRVSRSHELQVQESNAVAADVVKDRRRSRSRIRLKKERM